MSIIKLNNRGVRSATSFGSASKVGSLVFIKKITASSSSTIVSSISIESISELLSSPKTEVSSVTPIVSIPNEDVALKILGPARIFAFPNEETPPAS